MEHEDSTTGDGAGRGAGRFAGRVALVTGATSGIGRATAERLHTEGAAVVLAGRRVAEGEAVAAGLGLGRSRFVVTDVTDGDQVRALVAAATDCFGRLDVVVNAAGTVVVSPTATLRPAHWDRTIDLNLTAVFTVCQAALPALRAASPGAAIVNVASLAAGAGDPGMAAYCAAKAGVVNFSRSLALELAREGIRVNTVSPGAIDTPMTVATAGDPTVAAEFCRAIPLGRFGQPEEIAAAIAFVASDEARFMTGADLVIDGGVTAATGHPDLLDLFGLRR